MCLEFIEAYLGALFVLRKAENFLSDMEKGALGGRQDPGHEGPGRLH